tara:strand:+ start:165 stop:416 length:252 start_codon:yes stop_codon:yes gene_type:complete
MILKKLYKLGIRSLLIEGGEKITKSFLKDRLIDQFYLFKSPKNLSSYKKHLIFTSFNLLDKVYNKKSRLSFKLAKDLVTIYKK